MCLDANVHAATIDYLGGDRLSKNAPGGSYRIILDHNDATLAFWGSTRAAQRSVDRLRRFAIEAQSRPDARLMRARNVSIEWSSTPAKADSVSITDCLRS